VPKNKKSQNTTGLVKCAFNSCNYQPGVAKLATYFTPVDWQPQIY